MITGPQLEPSGPETERAHQQGAPQGETSALGAVPQGLLTAAGADGTESSNARLASTPVMLQRSGSGELRSLVMRRMQRGLGNQKTQQLVAQMRRPAQVQRSCSCGGQCESCKGKAAEEEESKVVQRQASTLANAAAGVDSGGEGAGSASSSGLAGGAAPADVIPADSPGQPLDHGTRSFMESRFGADFSDVRVHSDTRAAASADELAANAYTTGRDIYFAAGKYAPNSPDGQHLLAHELTHALQQGSSTRPAITAKLGDGLKIVPPDHPLELVAERAAEEFLPDAEVMQTGEERKRIDATGNALAIQTKSHKPGGSNTPQRIGTTGETGRLIFRQTTTSPGTPGGPDPCLDLLQAIIHFLNEVEKRIRDALDDKWDLFKFRPGRNPEEPDAGTWDGHRDRFYEDRDHLRRKIAEWESSDDCRGYPLSREQQEDLKEAYESKEKEFPGRPAPSMREAEPSFREKIAEALKKAGIPAWAVSALIVLIIAAIADPEPFSKVALIIGAAAAVLFFIAIGRPNDVPPRA
jgi:Domain of unknown function (DUF4157)